MARSLSVANATALGERRLMARDFLWIEPKDRDTNAIEPIGMWSDVGDISAPVIDPDTGATDTRAYYGAGTLIDISPIPLTANMQVQQVTITLNQIDDLVQQAVRQYDAKFARVEIHRALYDPETGVIVAPATCRFVGFVDSIEIKTPAEGEEGAVTLNCVDQTQEMLRNNPDTRNHESQKLRNPADMFFRDASVVAEWKINWGRNADTVKTDKKKGLFGWNNFLGFL